MNPVPGIDFYDTISNAKPTVHKVRLPMLNFSANPGIDEYFLLVLSACSPDAGKSSESLNQDSSDLKLRHRTGN